MYFSRPDTIREQGSGWWLAIVVLITACAMLLVMDSTFQANGLYGSRTLAVEKVVDKRLLRGRRNSTIPAIYLNHGSQRLDVRVMRDEYDTITIGQRLPIIIVPGRIGGPHVFLDRPGIKHSPSSRMAFFGAIIVVHFGLLFGLFHYLLRRARLRDDRRLEGFEARRLGLRQR